MELQGCFGHAGEVVCAGRVALVNRRSRVAKLAALLGGPRKWKVHPIQSRELALGAERGAGADRECRRDRLGDGDPWRDAMRPEKFWGSDASQIRFLRALHGGLDT